VGAGRLSSARRPLFVLTILAGSFLLFLVQPMIARMALPRLGGAPNVWNSAMLVYQALLLGGYAYAHAIGRLSLARQGTVHLAVLLLAALTLPLSLADIGAPAAGWEALWVPWLFVLTVGPAFFAISAQAPLMQRWFAAHPSAGNPYPLYAASNLGSFAGLLAFPLLAEPLLSIGAQSRLWAIGYGVLMLLVGVAAWNRRGLRGETAATEAGETIGWRRTGHWLALSAVPSGLMLSTTTFLTTDIMAMPLLWVIPLGLYLLSFSLGFAERRDLAGLFIVLAPVVLLVDGSVATFAAGRSGLLAAFASLVLLFIVAVALHARLYDDRPPPAQLTRFYLVMAAGGALGGVFAALLAPVLFDWTWEHPLLILGAAALLPLGFWRGLVARIDPVALRLALVAALGLTLGGAIWAFRLREAGAAPDLLQLGGLMALVLAAMLLAARRWSFVLACVALLGGLGGFASLATSFSGTRERSYFGVYSMQQGEAGERVLMHGTTIHGLQRAAPDERLPTAYYGPGSGVGLALAAADGLFGREARVGVVGLGIGTLACYRQPGQRWTFFELDPVVHELSRRGQFTFLERCAPDAAVVIGDARIALAKMAPARFDLLAIDAFSSDAIPLHLLTDEALGIYWRALDVDGLLLMHVSNRHVALEPVLARLAERRGLAVAVRRDVPAHPMLFDSTWVAFAESPARLAELTANGEWDELEAPEGRVWTDGYASILPHLRWSHVF